MIPLVAFRMVPLVMLAAMLIPSAAQGACEGLVEGLRGVVASVTDGDTVVLADGRVVRLIGTQAPKLPLGREGFVAWPLADEAKAALEALVLGQDVILRYGGEQIDRHGRALAHMFVLAEPEVWVQGEMLSQGWARVYSFPDNRRCLSQLLDREAAARAQRLGIWGNPYYSVRAAQAPGDMADKEGRYEIVEGRVLLADQAGGRVYLNFGRHWKEDFTAVIEPAALRLFADGGLDPLLLDGALVRVRGWLELHDGPRITITHPEQVEVVARP